MLITCPECELQVSDKASACPHCGYPMTGGQKRKPRSKNNKRRRLPNGFGQISEIKNRNLRNPFRAMVTVGKDENGRPVCKPLKPESYFPTYNDAYAALVEYNRNPYDLDSGMTVKDLFEEWSPKYINTLKGATAGGTVLTAWRFCSTVYDMRVKDLRARHIKGCLYEGKAFVKGIEMTAKPYMQNRIKSMFNLMLDYAVEYELTDKNYARTFELDDSITKEAQQLEKQHFPFTDKEMEVLWDKYEFIPEIGIILIQCYSGWRPRELISIRLEDVDLEKWTFTSGMKTKAGTNRTIPIHPRIRDIVRTEYEESKRSNVDWLFTGYKKNGLREQTGLAYRAYLDLFVRIVNEVGLNPRHRPHDPRVHFVTQAKKYKMDEYAIKHIVGHKITDITEKVYTKRSIEWLHEEIAKIP